MRPIIVPHITGFPDAIAPLPDTWYISSVTLQPPVHRIQDQSLLLRLLEPNGPRVNRGEAAPSIVLRAKTVRAPDGRMFDRDPTWSIRDLISVEIDLYREGNLLESVRASARDFDRIHVTLVTTQAGEHFYGKSLLMSGLLYGPAS